jgi:hypothetical protein
MSECKFKRGQVWENPDGEIMMITNVVSKLTADSWTVYYVTDECTSGFFDEKDTAIINNIKVWNTRKEGE